MSRSITQQRRKSRKYSIRKSEHELLEPRNLLTLGGMPLWLSVDHWHQGWELSSSEARQYAELAMNEEGSVFQWQAESPNAGIQDGALGFGCSYGACEPIMDESGNTLFVEPPENLSDSVVVGDGMSQPVLTALSDTFNLHSLPTADHTMRLAPDCICRLVVRDEPHADSLTADTEAMSGNASEYALIVSCVAA